MWQLNMCQNQKWQAVDTFDTAQAATRKIIELENYNSPNVFFSILVETQFGSDDEFLGHLEHTGKNTGRCYVVKRLRH
jgi:hypothetical protein